MDIKEMLQDVLNEENELKIEEEKAKHKKFLLRQKVDLIKEYGFLSRKIDELSKESNTQEGDYSRTKDKIEAMSEILKDYKQRIMSDRRNLEEDMSLTSFRDINFKKIQKRILTKKRCLLI